VVLRRRVAPDLLLPEILFYYNGLNINKNTCFVKDFNYLPGPPELSHFKKSFQKFRNGILDLIYFIT